MVRRWPSGSHVLYRVIKKWTQFHTCIAVQLSPSFLITLYLWTDTSVVEEHAASIFMVGIIWFRLG